MFDSIAAAFSSQAFVSGGITLALIGVAAMWLRQVPAKLAAWAKHLFITTLTVDSRDELLFSALIEYMDSRDALRRINNFTVRAVRSSTSSYQSLHDGLQQGGRPATLLSPGEGFHVFVLDGRLMWMKREIQVANSIIEKVSLSTLGRDKRALEQLIDQSMEHRIARELNRIAIYVPRRTATSGRGRDLATTASSTRSC